MEKGNITPQDFKKSILSILGVDLGFNYTTNKINEMYLARAIISHDSYNNTADLILRNGHGFIEWKDKDDFELFLKSLKSSNINERD